MRYELWQLDLLFTNEVFEADCLQSRGYFPGIVKKCGLHVPYPNFFLRKHKIYVLTI